jgi:hypothetical protein
VKEQPISGEIAKQNNGCTFERFSVLRESILKTLGEVPLDL